MSKDNSDVNMDSTIQESIRNTSNEYGRIYYETINSTVEYIFNPVAEFIGSYIPSIGKSVEFAWKLLSVIIALTPLFAVLFGGLSAVSDLSALQSMILSFDLRIVVASLLLVVAGWIFYDDYYSLDDRDEITTENILLRVSLLICASLGFIYFTAPLIYLWAFATIYGIGGYTVLDKELELNWSHDYVFDKLEVQKTVLRISIVGSLLIGSSVYGLSTYGQTLTEQQFTIGILLIAGLAFLLNIYQEQYIDRFYKKMGLDLTSAYWLLVPRLFVILGTGFCILNTTISSYYVISLFTPAVMGFIFWGFIDQSITNDPIMNRDYIYNTSSSSMTFGSFPVNNIIISDHTVNTRNGSMSFDINLKYKIDKDHEKKQLAIASLIGSLYHIDQSIDENSDIKQSEQDKFYSFYDDVVNYYMNEYDKSLKALNRWNENYRLRVMGSIAKTGHLSTQDLAERTHREKVSLDDHDDAYVDSA